MKRIFIIFSALFSLASTILFFCTVFGGMNKTLFKKTELTDADKQLIESLGTPDWKSYLVSYFMLLFLLITSILLICAVFKNGGTCASLSVIFTVVATILAAFPFKDVVFDESNLLYDTKMSVVAIGSAALSFLFLTFYSLILSKSERKK